MDGTRRTQPPPEHNVHSATPADCLTGCRSLVGSPRRKQEIEVVHRRLCQFTAGCSGFYGSGGSRSGLVNVGVRPRKYSQVRHVYF